MGSQISTIVFQPLLILTAATLMVIALYFQPSTCSNSGSPDDNWGQQVFKIDTGLAVVILIIAIILNIVMSLMV